MITGAGVRHETGRNKSNAATIKRDGKITQQPDVQDPYTGQRKKPKRRNDSSKDGTRWEDREIKRWSRSG